jgi:hypothetical protein
MTRRFLTLALLSAVAILVSVVVHNCLAGVLHTEELVFFLIAVVVAPLGLVVGLGGAAVCTFVSWKRRAHGV